MLNMLKAKNSIKVYSVHDDEFKIYGKVIDFDAEEIIDAANKIDMPESGVKYITTEPTLEALRCADEIHSYICGESPAQIGFCWGYNSYMNAMEYHKCNEINIAITPLVLILGLEYDMTNNEYNSDNAVAFYLNKGDVVEVYSTSLHYCPCQVSDEGFKCIVGLPKFTNEPLENSTDDKLLRNKNKWVICHIENTTAIEKGIYPGIYGTNHKICY